jgi:hypothetical protein
MNPLLKFGVIKIVVFFTFWQGMVCNMLVGWGILHEPEDAQVLKNFLLCLEMFLVALVAPIAFSHKEYAKAAVSEKLHENPRPPPACPLRLDMCHPMSSTFPII